MPDHAPIKLAILKALKEIGAPAGAARIRQSLLGTGHHLQSRTVRSYLLQLDHDGLTRCVSRRSGRALTERGHHELAHARIIERVGFIAARIDSLVYRMTYDLRTGTGTIVANTCLLPKTELRRALAAMEPVFNRQLGMGHRLAVVPEAGTFAGHTVPAGMVLLGTVCSVTVNGVLLKQGIPVTSRFGGLMEMRQYRPVRFVALIEYTGTTLDPLEAFIRAGMTRAGDCARTGDGVVGVSFREVPAAALSAVQRVKKVLARHGMDGILAIGAPNQPLFDIPVAEGRAGLIVAGGLNPIAALYETATPAEFHSLAEVEDAGQFSDFSTRR